MRLTPLLHNGDRGGAAETIGSSTQQGERILQRAHTATRLDATVSADSSAHQRDVCHRRP